MDRLRWSPGYGIVDHGLPGAGFALLLAGLTVAPAALPVAWLALGLTLFRWVAEADGVPWPLRLGRRVIQTVGCWEVPLTFTVRHRGETLLFTRGEDPDGSGWSDAYTVYAGPDGAQAVWELPVAGSWAMRGHTPVEALRFERHERVCYVEHRSLERAVARASA